MRQITLYIREPEITEILSEAERQDRSASWLLIEAWKRVKPGAHNADLWSPRPTRWKDQRMKISPFNVDLVPEEDDPTLPED